MKLSSSVFMIFSILLPGCDTQLPRQTCITLNGRNLFTVGGVFDLHNSSIYFNLEEGKESYARNTRLNSYASIDSSLSILTQDGVVAGAISIIKEDRTDRLISVTYCWVFMTKDNLEKRLDRLREIKQRYLNCLDLDELDIRKGGEYKVEKRGWTETFTLTPRFRANGIDARYWALYYSIK